MSKITLPDNSILLLEGGSLRGLFTAGVLDTFMENDVYFPAVAGVSAGSLNALNYASHQPGRSASINLRYRHDSRYFGPKAALRGGSLFGLKFMLNDVKKEVPFDEGTFAHGGMRVIAVATNVETGKPAYFEKGKTDFPFDEAVRASASLPLASVPVVLDGQPYLDGGCSCPIALNWALNEGFEKIVVITTRQKGFRKAMPGQRMVDQYDDFYGDKPLFLADMLTPAGVPLLWPCRWRFRLPILVPQKGNQLERFLCMALFAWAIWMPQTVQENSAVRWSSQMINTLQMQFNRFITHQID